MSCQVRRISACDTTICSGLAFVGCTFSFLLSFPPPSSFGQFGPVMTFDVDWALSTDLRKLNLPEDAY